MHIRPLHTEQDYQDALKVISALGRHGSRGRDAGRQSSGRPGRPGRTLRGTAFPVGPPRPIAAIRFRMEQAGLTARDMQPYLGKPESGVRGT